jgi:hypothetical protein
MSIYRPTWLYIKQHNQTGLKYFGKTVSIDPVKYKGSGKYWLNHIRKHGNDVSTIWLQQFDDQNQLMEYAINFSTENNIVNSAEWANLMTENGVTGGYCPNNHLIIYNKSERSLEHGCAISAAKCGKATKQFPVIVNGIPYPSMVNAARSLNVVEHTIYRWIKSGKAIRV